jgi:hypothetical protein
MTKTIFMEKYPVYSLEIPKDETTCKDVDDIISRLKAKIDEHKIATFIGIFDHYSHTKNLGGEINPNIKDEVLSIY